MLSVGSIINGAFAFPMRFPIALGAWSLIYALIAAATWFTIPTTMPAEGAEFSAGEIWIMLAQLAALPVAALLTSAAYRLTLRPEPGQLMGIRLGGDELRILGLTLIMLLVVVVLVIAIALAIGLTAMTVQARISELAFAGLAVLLTLAGFAAFAWFQVRLSLAYPLTFVRRRLVIGESWELTSGRFWPLFGGYLVVGLFLLLLWSAVGVMSAMTSIGDSIESNVDPGSAAGGGPNDVGVVTILGWLLEGVSSALSIGLVAGATATVVRELGIDREDIARTFE